MYLEKMGYGNDIARSKEMLKDQIEMETSKKVKNQKFIDYKEYSEDAFIIHFYDLIRKLSSLVRLKGKYFSLSTYLSLWRNRKEKG